uniref:Uncharacterized protein n=1 Tax=Arundo donax TaxID=35708 RepID=A0A0A9VHN8_ARUDO
MHKPTVQPIITNNSKKIRVCTVAVFYFTACRYLVQK